MAFCYIIHSEKINRYYTSITSEKVENRLQKHIKKFYAGQHFTHSADDWRLFLSIQCISIDQARKIEFHIKKMKSRNYIRNLKQYPEIKEKLLEKYS